MTWAELDLKSAQVLFEHEYWAPCIMHCQQAAEKAVKAAYIAAGNPSVPRTHHVDRLARDVGAPQEVIDKAEELAAEYLVSRYPVAQLPGAIYGAEDARRRLADAELVYKWALERITDG